MVLFGDILIGAAAFVAGVYFADAAKSAWSTAKAVFAWVKAKLS